MAESENEQKEDEQTEGEKKSPDSTEKAEEKKEANSEENTEAGGGGEEEEEEDKCPECEECPPAGAPAWMATFADMATLLMAFFVLILSFAEMNVPKFKQISGTMRNSFGIQRLIPVVEMPKATSIIAQHFSPAQAEPTPINTIRQQTTDDSQENVEVKKDDNPHESETSADVKAVEQALAKEIAEGEVVVKAEDGKVVVEMIEQPTTGGGKAQEDGQNSGGKTTDGEKVSGLVAQETIELFAKVAEVQSQVTSAVQIKDGTGASDGQGTAQENEVDAQFEKIKADLSNEISKGLAEVEREGDKIIVRLAEQGSFQSGRADLQAGFLPLLRKVGSTIAGTNGQVRIEGHTDNVPVMVNDRFSSNWDLSGARAGAVADYLLEAGGVAPGRIAVQGFADTKPIDTNDTASGRAKNRRIEVIVDGS
ncbi:MAG: flagellar motor protein [Proteobacteria bacterium]|nr:flagellar motor protein [Pseudomonadota bacterium]